MTKRKESSESKTKNPGQSCGVKTQRAKKRETDHGVTSEEDKLVRKLKPKSRLSSKAATLKNSPSKPTTNTHAPAGNTSKYFQSPVKEESDSEDDNDMVTSPPPASMLNVKKPEKDDEDEAEEEEDSEEDDDWEEVEELAEPLDLAEPSEPVLPPQPVEIEIETPEVRKRKKREAEFESYLRRMMNKYKKDVLMDTHKVHLMCLIANGMFRNRLCSEPDLLAITLSLLPAHFGAVAKERISSSYLSGLLKWFRTTFTLNPSLPCEERSDPRALLERRLASLSARSHQEMTHLFLLVLRSLQLFCRLVLSLQPVSFKAPPAKAKGAATSPHASGKSSSNQDATKVTSPEPKVSPGTKRAAAGGNAKGGRGGKKAKRKVKQEEEEEEEEEEEKAVKAVGQRPKNSKRRSVASKVSYKEEGNSEEEEVLSDEEEFQAKSEDESEDSEREFKPSQKRKAQKNKKATQRRSSGGGRKVKEEEQEDVEGEDEEGDETTNHKLKRTNTKKKGPGADEWLEVYLEKTSTWVCVHVEHGVETPHLCTQNATAPVTYVVSVDGEGFVKDLGKKYDPRWMTSSRKRRVDEEWWDATLEPFLGPEDERDRREDKELQNKLQNKPLPVSIAEYKNHPLYALKRHLLKYEAIYPPTAAVLGYCRGEPVYSRDCVQTLHSRDTWLKEARTVRLGEEPFKMVRGFSNRSRKARIMSEQKNDNDLALFGEWQTEEYQPPVAVDGKVPRNDFGNVYLFKPCMLPVGCVHMRLSNLNRVARKLDIDAAPAVTGFDFHGGYSHAVTDGYIVCEEHEEILNAAWVEDQELQKQKEREKREKRVVSNWTLLVKGLLIRERLKQRYGKKEAGSGSLAHGDGASDLSSDEETAEGGAKTASETLAMSWPQNMQTEEEAGKKSSGLKKKTTKREKKGQDKLLFPFEKA